MEDCKKLHILWTNADPVTSHLMVMMYATNCLAKSWWDEVTVIIWGKTAEYVAKDKGIQERVKLAMSVGVKFSACVHCAEQLSVVPDLESLGVEVIPWGKRLSDLLQNGENLLTV